MHTICTLNTLTNVHLWSCLVNNNMHWLKIMMPLMIGERKRRVWGWIMILMTPVLRMSLRCLSTSVKQWTSPRPVRLILYTYYHHSHSNIQLSPIQIVHGSHYIWLSRLLIIYVHRLQEHHKSHFYWNKQMIWKQSLCVLKLCTIY